MDCSWLGDDRIDCGNDEQNWDPNGTLRSLKSPDLLSWDSDQTITLRTTSFFFMFFCYISSLSYLNLFARPKSKWRVSMKKTLLPMRFGMSMLGIGRRNPWQTSVRYLETWMWPFDLLEFFHFWYKDASTKDASTIWMVCVLNSNPLKHFPWLPKIPGIKWLSRELSGLSVQILLGKLRVSVSVGDFVEDWSWMMIWIWSHDTKWAKIIHESGLSEWHSRWFSWVKRLYRKCAGKRENLQVYGLVIIIIHFFPTKCSTKNEGWISWNGGYMDKTRW